MVSLAVSKVDRLEYAYAVYLILHAIPNQSQIIWEIKYKSIEPVTAQPIKVLRRNLLTRHSITKEAVTDNPDMMIAVTFKLMSIYLISDVQSAFIANRQILDGSFILNELISWCKFKKFKAMVFKVDFKKAYDSVSRIMQVGLFSGISINNSLQLSHLLYVDDAVFVGEWNDSNLATIVHVLKCFFLASSLKINMHKSKLMGTGVGLEEVSRAANIVECSTLSSPFSYLGVKVRDCMSRLQTWNDVTSKIMSRLSRWKFKTLSIGGRLALLKLVLGSTPLYQMSLFKVPKGVIKNMESLRCKFFHGAEGSDRKMSWFSWDKVLVSKQKEGLGVSSLFALNRALLFNWVWWFISKDSSLLSRCIHVFHGTRGSLDFPTKRSRKSLWLDIIKEVGSVSAVKIMV
ncbi:hypothetical protein Tco_0345026 [Tanacetum coccineum]